MTDDRFYRATAYPYAIPDFSFVFEKGDTKPIRSENDIPDLSGRHPVIACGSNLSHERLLLKYGKNSEALPVIRMQLQDFDTVYAAHFAHYGAIPATLHPSKGTTVSLAVNWLSDEQLARMHETEVDNYHYCRLSNIDLKPEFGESLNQAYAYISATGCWTPGKNPIPLAAVAATNRRWDASLQKEIQEQARGLHAPEQELNEFIIANIEDENIRHHHAASLQQATKVFNYKYSEKLEMRL